MTIMKKKMTGTYEIEYSFVTITKANCAYKL